MEQLILSKILETEGARFILYAIMFAIIYFAFVRRHILKMIKDVKAFPDKMDKIEEISTLQQTILEMNKSLVKVNSTLHLLGESMKEVLHNDLFKMVEKAKKEGGRTHLQDEQFKEKWDRYVAFGDGKGDGLLQDWDTLSWMSK